MNASTKQRTELSVIPKGHWRNKWFSRELIYIHDRENPGVVTGTKGPGEFFNAGEYPSAEIAEQRAIENLEYHADRVALKGIRYLGPVFFPDTA